MLRSVRSILFHPDLDGYRTFILRTVSSDIEKRIRTAHVAVRLSDPYDVDMSRKELLQDACGSAGSLVTQQYGIIMRIFDDGAS